MVGPGLAGGWLDNKLGTKFITMIGFAVGMGLAVIALVIFTKIKPAVGDSKLEVDRTLDVESSPSSVVKKESGLLPSEQPLPKVPGAEVWEQNE
jgi:hypothetical protein